VHARGEGALHRWRCLHQRQDTDGSAWIGVEEGGGWHRMRKLTNDDGEMCCARLLRKLREQEIGGDNDSAPYGTG
jgi:hypothetical protein